jgi:ABC-2 type transport system ATP-binding protein
VIELDRLVKKFGKFEAVSELSLKINPGEVFGFLGVNGAGKTTTLRMLVGILEPTSGAAFLGGFNVHTHPTEAKQLLGFIPDRPHLYGKLTAREYLYFCADLHNVPAQVADQEIDRLLQDYALVPWQNELIDSFSHGMKQRLATCGALVHRPKILVVDEPMVGLDPHGAQLMKSLMKRYAKEGMTVLLSTHSLHVAEEVCNRLAIIDRGRIIATGTFEEIKSQAGIAHGNLENVFLQITSSSYDYATSSS